MNKKQICVLLMVMFTAGIAQAETGNGMYIGIDGVRNGTSFTKGNSDANYGNFGGRIFLGSKFNNTLSFEGGYMISPKNTINVRDADFSMDYSTLTSAADASLVITPIQEVSGMKVKVGVALMHASVDKQVQSRYSSMSLKASTIVPGVVAGIAYEYPVADGVSANVGYTYYHQMSSNPDQAVQGLDHDHDVSSLGVKKQF